MEDKKRRRKEEREEDGSRQGKGEAANWLATERKSEASFAKVLLGMKTPTTTPPPILLSPSPSTEGWRQDTGNWYTLLGLIRTAVISCTSRPILCSLTPPQTELMCVRVCVYACLHWLVVKEISVLSASKCLLVLKKMGNIQKCVCGEVKAWKDLFFFLIPWENDLLFTD